MMIRIRRRMFVTHVQSFLFVLVFSWLGAAPAFAQRVGIVYSEPSANQFFDKFAYNQLFMAMQNQVRMAGIPYDLLTEDDLINVAKLAGHDALIIPSMQFVTASKVSAIEAALDQAVFNNHIGLIVSGNFMTNSQTGAVLAGDPYSRMQRWLGVTYGDSASNVAAEVSAQNVAHPAMRDYAANELIRRYSQIWFDSFVPVASQTATLLATLRVGSQNYNGILATQTGGRNVHFSNDQVLGDTNLAWSAVQWVVYGDQTPVGLKMGRQDNLFVARTDMDQSMYAEELNLTDIPLYNYLASWKSSYNFLGSYYLNIGNNVGAGEYTDWSVSGPLFKKYLALGSEIGTHSWTHPDNTSSLSSTQLEYQFNQSKLEIERQLGITVLGTAIPGNPESLAVDQQLEQYFSYISGRSGIVGSGYPGAIGRMTPSARAIYFSLNLSPDFTLIEWLRYSASQAQQIWQNEFNDLRNHASLPIIHWLWHDYGPTISLSDGYTVAMYANTIAMANANGSEFVTATDATKRINSYETAALTVAGSNPIIATVNAQNVGQFSLRVRSTQVINQVNNWYAYDDHQVFLPNDGGQFTIQLGTGAADVTHLTSLPMRARLLTSSGNGNDLTFSFEGEGTVRAHLSPVLAVGVSVTGASSYSQSGNTLTMNFTGIGVHTAALSGGAVTNLPPIANNQSVTTRQGTAVTMTLSASDPNGDALTYVIVTGPLSGQLSGTPPNLIYTPNAAFTGNDSLTFRASDGALDSNTATVSITVTPSTTTAQMTFTSVAGEDGWVLESTETSNVGGSVNASNTGSQAIRLGDDSRDRQYKAILSFNTSTLPAGATIQSMRLEITRGGTTGTNAFTTHGPAYIDIKRGGFGTSNALQNADFHAAADATQVGTITNQGASGTTYAVDLNNAAFANINRTGRTQLRLYFPLDDNDDLGNDYLGFYSGGSSTSTYRPRLVVTYQQ